MLCITESNDRSADYSGVLGLGRKGTSYDGQMYITQLYKGGVISEEMFSMMLDLDTTDSYMDLGPANTALFKPGAKRRWIPMPGTFNTFWQSAVDGFYVGDSDSKKYTTDYALGIIDSGTTILLGPTAEINKIIELVTADIYSWTDSQGYTYFSCSQYRDKLPSVFIRWGGYWLEI
jgi:hypothetical protein